MFLRFVTTRVHKDSRKPEGVFAAMYSLLDSGSLDSEEQKRLREIRIWFNKNLPPPPDSFSATRAIFWFKSNAEESIGQIWELVHLLRLHGHHVEVFKCRRLANIVVRRSIPGCCVSFGARRQDNSSVSEERKSIDRPYLSRETSEASLPKIVRYPTLSQLLIRLDFCGRSYNQIAPKTISSTAGR